MKKLWYSFALVLSIGLLVGLGVFLNPEDVSADEPLYYKVSEKLDGIPLHGAVSVDGGVKGATINARLIENFAKSPVSGYAKFNITSDGDLSVASNEFLLWSENVKGDGVSDLTIKEEVCTTRTVKDLRQSCSDPGIKTKQAGELVFTKQPTCETTDYGIKTYDTKCETKPLSKNVEFTANTPKTFIVEGKTKPRTVNDWKISIDGFEPEWAFWNTTWDCIVNLTVAENAGVAREYAYVNTHVNPAADWSTCTDPYNHSIRLIDSNNEEVEFQLDNVTLDGSTLMDSFNLHWQTNFTASQNKSFQIYVKYTEDQPTFSDPWSLATTAGDNNIAYRLNNTNWNFIIDDDINIHSIGDIQQGRNAWESNLNSDQSVFGRTTSGDPVYVGIFKNTNKDLDSQWNDVGGAVFREINISYYGWDRRIKFFAKGNYLEYTLIRENASTTGQTWGGWRIKTNDGGTPNVAYDSDEEETNTSGSFTFTTGAAGIYSASENYFLAHSWDQSASGRGTGTNSYDAGTPNNGNSINVAAGAGGETGDSVIRLYFGKGDGSISTAEARTVSTANYQDVVSPVSPSVAWEGTANQAPTVPVWANPANDTTLTTSNFFVNWTNSTDPDGDAVTYAVEIDDDSDFSSPLVTNNSIVETATPTNLWVSGLGDGNLYFRVQATDGSATSAWSDTLTLLQDTITITFVSQTPADLNTTLTGTVEINYTISSDDGVDTSTVRFYHKTNHTQGEEYIYQNGVITRDGWHSGDEVNTNISSLWTFDLEDYEIYPGTYNYDENAMENTPHTNITIDSSNEAVRVELYNISNAENNSFLEVSFARETGASTELIFWYCNTSYVSGKFTTSNACGQFANFLIEDPDHIHGGYSYHTTVPFTILNKEISGVRVTNTSYIVMQSTSNNGWNIGAIPESNRTNTWTTTTTGQTWNAYSGTVDLHAHQFDGTDKFWHMVGACTSEGACKNSTEMFDVLEAGQAAPTSPGVYNPSEGYTGDVFDINYTAAGTTGTIGLYNITLRYSNGSQAAVISADNNNHLGYNWNSSASGVDDASYRIRVDVFDNLGQNSFGISQNITLNNNRPTTPTLIGAANLSVYVNGTAVYGCTGSSDYSNNSLNYLFFKDGALAQNGTNTTYTLTSTANETVTVHCYSQDNLPYQQISENSNSLSVNFNTTVIADSSAGYPAKVLALNSWEFNLTIDYNYANVLGLRSSFTHNNTNWTVTQTNLSGTRALFEATPVMPYVSTDTNVTFFWDLTPTGMDEVDGDTQRFSYSMQILTSNLTTCTIPAPDQVVILNVSSLSEKNSTALNFSLTGYLTLWTSTQEINSTLSISETAKRNVLFCVNNVTNGTFRVSSDFEYNAEGYDQRYWFLRSFFINTSKQTEDITTYLLNEGDSDSTRIVLTDDTETPLPNRKIYAQRKDYSTGSFFTVAMASTDSEGEAYFPLEWYDASYKFVVYNPDNELEYSSEEAVIQTTPVFIRVSADSIMDKFENFDNLDMSLSFDNSTKTFTLNYADSSGAIREVCMDVRRVSTYIKNVTVCSTCSVSSSDIIECYVGDDEGVFTAITYAKQNPEQNMLALTYENIRQLGDEIGLDGVIYSLFLLLTIVFMFVYSPTTAVVTTMLSLAVVGLFGFASLPYMAVASVFIVGIVAIAVMRS